MQLCKCGGKITQHGLASKQGDAREAWTCTACKRYSVITLPCKPANFSHTPAKQGTLPMDKTVTCLHCQHWSLQSNPAMSRLGFAVCKVGKGQMYTTTSGHFPRICIRFAPLPEADVQKRVVWLDKQRSQL